ncbi:MAG TPA: hypothetical protein VEF03_05545 [Candidatus Binataceae bacterium]|nr:hypothetical protein [Candidatus Binataceae bacterium]
MGAVARVTSGRAEEPRARNTLLGVSFSPAHVPFPKDPDIRQFFVEAAEIGSHVTWVVEWESIPKFEILKAVRDMTARAGMKFHLHLSPIALFGGRKTPAIPAYAGGGSFADSAVRQAYVSEVVNLASLKPDYLGLATEVNFLGQNPPEFEAFTTLANQAYGAVKEKFPTQTVTISFQWDVIRGQRDFGVLHKFDGAMDVVSFTSYPDAFGIPVSIPRDYYSSVRQAAANQRIGFSEIGWSSAPPSQRNAAGIVLCAFTRDDAWTKSGVRNTRAAS